MTTEHNADPARICDRAQTALSELIEVMNAETVLLRAGKLGEASQLTARKTSLAQDYVGAARAIQLDAAAFRAAAPEAVERLRQGHAALATQLAENLRVLASARSLADDLLSDVARRLGQDAAPAAYSAGGVAPTAPAGGARGISVNRSL